jgi:hypothetical protein
VANRFDVCLQLGDVLGEPGQFFGGDDVLRRVAGVHIGLPEQFEAPAAEAIVAGPSFDQAWGYLFALRAKEVEAVGFW